MAVTVPLKLSDQEALERVTHSVLDAYGSRDWAISLVPFLTMPGYMLEVALDDRYVERRLLDSASPAELETALLGVTRRQCAPRD